LADRHEEEVPDAAFGVVVGTFHTVGYNRESEPPEQYDCLRAVCFFPYRDQREGGEFRTFIPTVLRLEGGRQTWGWWPWKLEDTGVKIEKVIPQSEITLLSEFQKVYDSVGRRVGMW
jgi:hypothetical protein